MTEAINNFTDFEEKGAGVQCALCLAEIPVPVVSESDKKNDWVQCPRCDYHQPLTKLPRARDLAIFGGVISSVYIATIIAVLLTR